MTETELIPAARARFLAKAAKPSAEDLICAHLVERGFVEPHQGDPVTAASRRYYDAWHRLCSVVVDGTDVAPSGRRLNGRP